MTAPASVAVPPTTDGFRRGARRRPLVVGAALTGVVVVAAALAVARAGGGSDAGGDAAATTATATATVERRDLVDREPVDGTLGYDDGPPVVSHLSGTLTWLPGEGTVVERGQALFEVSGAAVPLLYGERPAWRAMANGTSGVDVRQLEENLRELGFGRGLAVDGKYDAATAAAVRRWQAALGVERTGVVELGAAVFLPGPARVASSSLAVGTPLAPGATVYETTGTTRVVTVALDARKQDRVEAGDTVEVELPDGGRVAGTVASVGTVAVPSSDSGDEGFGGGSSTSTVEVVVTLADPSATGSLDGAPVEVLFTREAREGVLAVPVQALLALREGGYAVEVERGGRRSLVAVETGLFAEGMVEVEGDLREGDRVVVPA